MLTRLIYHSENHLGAGRKMIAELNTIMDVSNAINERNGITGALLFDTLWFVQILEGDRDAVSATLRRIMRDERTDGVTIMDARPTDVRMFGNWWMGLGFLRGDNVSLAERHGLAAGKLDPRRMTAEHAVALALDLSRVGLDRRLAAEAA